MADAMLSPEAPLPPVEPEPTAPMGDMEAAEDAAPLGAVQEGSSLNLTVEDVPELADLKMGDQIVFEVSNISEDGGYALTAVPPTTAEPTAPPEPPLTEEPMAGGREAVLSELMG